MMAIITIFLFNEEGKTIPEYTPSMTNHISENLWLSKKLLSLEPKEKIKCITRNCISKYPEQTYSLISLGCWFGEYGRQDT